MFDPEAVVQRFPHLDVRWTTLMQDNQLGRTDGAVIWLNKNQLTSQADKRCTLTHELVHCLAGHQGHQPEAIERKVRHDTAYLLVSHKQLVDGLYWTRDLYELAENLTVTPPVMRDRLELPDARALMERAHFQEWT